ncbi:heme A synthase [Alicyclobacillus sp. SO9]|uniref:COX15/CtaA family protein n=1 Tax=Alicyclobacillus sp. SO9 TaxID=2665646 RepID=UPI0018E8265A|nr:COX15/CtaA family protein [Alicyclobacillus sp. SO9]QQE77491.1 COX15/CtaA family protein [Alicyclobacillus sp. SO9]
MSRATSSAGLKALAVITTVGLFIVNIVGFIDTETGSTFGCGNDWPLCNGDLIPHKWGIHTLIEFGHRAIVGIVTVLLVFLVVWVLMKYRQEMKARLLVWISAGFVVVQAALGAMAVFFVNPPWVIAFHFGFSLLAFSGVFLLTVSIWKYSNPTKSEHLLDLEGVQDRAEKSMRSWVLFLFVYLYCAIYLGAFVSSQGVGASFRGWPFPTETAGGLTLFLDYAHRTVAFGLFVFVLTVVVKAYRLKGQRPDLYKGSVYLLTFTVLQIFSGAFVVYTHYSLSSPLQLSGFLIHVSIMTFLFTSLAYMGLQLLPRQARARAKQQAMSY